MEALIKTVTVEATPEELWRLWTTQEGIESFFAPRARVELRVGGPYEMLFLLDAPEGSQGGEGCTVLDFDAPKRLEFTWNFPPQIPSIRNEHTRVRLDFEPVDAARTRVTLTQSEWQEGPEWEEGYEYFDAAWGRVLENLEKHCAES